MTDGPYHGPRRRLRMVAPVDTFPTFDEIAHRAYEIFVAEGRHIERVFDCWDRAEQELLDRAARRVIR